ncbi:MAG: ferric reductase-like transmembrane domain-containing protein [Candidatus Dojkabacteria bacterium]|nr:ferric reductase-like transmembrane domain-containing protein [Candidatus Dojkabacteria bacterium]
MLFIGELSGYLGIHLLLLQYFLSSRNSFTVWFEDIVYLVKLHKIFGKYGISFIIFHVFFLFLHYIINLDYNIISIDFSSNFGIYKFFGQLSFYIFLIVWITSVFFRSKISYRIWKKLHMLGYIAFLFVLLHSIFLSNKDSYLINLYLSIGTFLFILILLHRFIKFAAILKHKLKVINVIRLNDNVTEIELHCSFVKKIKYGQFMYLQISPFKDEHPYTISKVDIDKQAISFTVKHVGKHSTQLSGLKPGNFIYADGPYGVFTREIFDVNDKSDIIIISGGVGITPFVEVIRSINKLSKNVYLFYFNRAVKDIIYRDIFLEKSKTCSNYKYIEILSDQPDFEGEKGYFSVEILKRYVSGSLIDKKYFVCGPPKMIEFVMIQLKQIRVPLCNIYYEEFGY